MQNYWKWSLNYKLFNSNKSFLHLCGIRVIRVQGIKFKYSNENDRK